MSQLREKIREQLERASETLEGLTPRDRALLLGLIGAAVLAIVGGVAWTMSRSLGRAEAALADRQQKLQLVRELAASHAADAETAREIEDRIGQHKGTDLPAFMEQAAGRAQLADRLEGVREKGVTTTGDIEDRLYTVTLTNLSTSDLGNILYEIETAGYPLRIRESTIRTRGRGDEKLLTVTLDVSAFSLIESGAGEEG